MASMISDVEQLTICLKGVIGIFSSSLSIVISRYILLVYILEILYFYFTVTWLPLGVDVNITPDNPFSWLLFTILAVTTTLGTE